MMKSKVSVAHIVDCLACNLASIDTKLVNASTAVEQFVKAQSSLALIGVSLPHEKACIFPSVPIVHTQHPQLVRTDRFVDVIVVLPPKISMQNSITDNLKRPYILHGLPSCHGLLKAMECRQILWYLF